MSQQLDLRRSIILTALPYRVVPAANAGETSTLRLSVYVSPRLWVKGADQPPLTLNDYPEFQDFPALLAQMTFRVAFDNGTILDSTLDSVPRSDVWKAIFPASTPVIPFEFDNPLDAQGNSKSHQSPRLGDLHTMIQDVYTRVGTDPAYGLGADLPSTGRLSRDPVLNAIAMPTTKNPIYDIPRGNTPPAVLTPPRSPAPDKPDQSPRGCLAGCLLFLLTVLRAFLSLVKRIATGMFGASGISAQGNGKAMPINAAAATNALKQYLTPYKFPLPTTVQFVSEFDFHQIVASTGDFPELMRRLGLVLDLTIPLDAAIPRPTGTVKIEVVWSAIPSHTHLFSPRTHYELNDAPGAASFTTRARDSSLMAGGLLNVAGDKFVIVQEEVVGGALKLENAATEIIGAAKNVQTMPPKAESLPALRTTGISLVQPDLPDQFALLSQIQAALNVFLAGQDESPQNTPSPDHPSMDEVFAEDVQRGHRIDVHDRLTNQWHSLHERILTMTFTNAPDLSPDPGDADPSEGFVQTATSEDPSAESIVKMHESLFTWDGWSLSVPRPGKPIPPEKGGDSSESLLNVETKSEVRVGSLPPLRFGVDYRLRVRTVDLAGNSVFNPNEAPFNSMDGSITPPFMYRRFEPVAPPTVVLYKEPSPLGLAPLVEGESLERMVVRSSIEDAPALLAQRNAQRFIVPPKISQQFAERHSIFDGKPPDESYSLAAREAGGVTHKVVASGSPPTFTLVPVSTVSYVSLDPANPSDQRRLTVQTKPEHELNYLPDPFARGVLLYGLPPVTNLAGSTAKLAHIPFAAHDKYPDILPFRLALKIASDGTSSVGAEWDAASQVLTVTLPPAARETIRISSYLSTQVGLNDLAQMGVWDWIASSNPANLDTITKFTRSGRNWLLMPYREITLLHAVRRPLSIPAVNNAQMTTREYGATSVTVSMNVLLVDGKSTEKVDVRAEWKDPLDTGSGAIQERSAQVQVGTVANIQSGVKETDQTPLTFTFDAGDTKYHALNYTPTATTRFREYFPVGTPASELIRPIPGGEAPLLFPSVILNSLRPEVPVVTSVLPSFKWVQPQNTDEILPSHGYKVQRIGSILRVYLSRPWFTSGDHERLGVVFLPDVPFSDLPPNLKPLVTYWGSDPIFDAPPAPVSAAKANFQNFVADGDKISLQELDQPVSVVGYPVTLNEERNLWYADVEMSLAASYFPFVKLALVRYQPNSVEDAHISRVVQADFTQLVPGRTATFNVGAFAGGKQPVEVIISGDTYRSVALDTAAKTSFSVYVEEFTRPELGGFGWERVSPNLTPQPVAAPLLLRGTVTVPGEFKRGRYRIVINEAEGLPHEQPDTGVDSVERTIYADIFPRGADDWFSELLSFKP